MTLHFEVKRYRMSVTQGEAEVFVNSQSIVTYGDIITLNGQYHKLGNWGSSISDKEFIKAAIKQYSSKIAIVLN